MNSANTKCIFVVVVSLYIEKTTPKSAQNDQLCKADTNTIHTNIRPIIKSGSTSIPPAILDIYTEYHLIL